ncbi:hypothetical protein [Peribacillus deserti]|uniref:Uncharacterized protein n=1 Tax=Peribacillus deserti TaxID=673318 RepID=A0A2N5M2S1_9BACI|nr:hypothetical protein [Peribacillus deserti]PLT28669.1 hypothetical protein CUU66_17380 [Peribacillus deserti]
MRKYAFLKEKVNNICKVMIYHSTDGIYVFLYNTLGDKACFADGCFENMLEAEEFCKDLGVKDGDWFYIDDPLKGCQHDIIFCKR